MCGCYLFLVAKCMGLTSMTSLFPQDCSVCSYYQRKCLNCCPTLLTQACSHARHVLQLQIIDVKRFFAFFLFLPLFRLLTFVLFFQQFYLQQRRSLKFENFTKNVES